MGNFQNELEELINKHNKENGSNTPDYILAQYLYECLSIFDIAIKMRDTWYEYQDHINSLENNSNGNPSD